VADPLATALDAIIAKGRAEYPDFDDRSHFAVAVSAAPDEFRHALAELGTEAHRVVARLADDPDEAARILALRGTKLGTAIGRYAATAEPKPEPPKPAPAGPDVYDENLPMADWVKAWDKRQADARKPRAPSVADIHDPKISMEDFVLVRARQEAARREAKRFR
jgi:hypothetical protein